MTEERYRLPIAILKLFDLVVVVLSFGLTTALIVHAEGRIPLSRFPSLRTKTTDFAIFALALLLCHFVFSACGLYRSRRLSSRRGEMADVSKATTLSVVCFVAIGSVFSVRMITLSFLALFWVTSTAGLCTFRFLLRVALARIRTHGRNLRYMLILGTNPRAIDFATKINAKQERGYRLLGFVDDDWQGLAEFKTSGFRLVSNYAGLAEFLRHNVVDEVAIYLPLRLLLQAFRRGGQPVRTARHPHALQFRHLRRRHT